MGIYCDGCSKPLDANREENLTETGGSLCSECRNPACDDCGKSLAKRNEIGDTTCAECQGISTKDDIKADGHERGANVASWLDIPELGSAIDRFEAMELTCAGRSDVVTRENCAELMELRAYEGELNARQFSPFEFTAKRLNDLDSELETLQEFEPGNEALDYEPWEEFYDGITEGIQEEIARRAPLFFSPAPAHDADGSSRVGLFVARPSDLVSCLGQPHIQGKEGKTTVEWRFRDQHGNIWTLYDYKQVPDGGAYSWHIGTVAAVKERADEFTSWLEEKMSQVKNGCDSCEATTINGVFCHETGCQNA